MLIYGTGAFDEKPKSYKSYKNDSFTKRKNDLSNMLSRIKQCSLKEEDKKTLMKQLAEIMNEEVKKSNP